MNDAMPPAPTPVGVGFVGAGPVAQAIHVPTLRRLPDHFTVTHVVDVDADRAGLVADPWGARSSTSLEVLLDDAAVDVVAIFSPHQFHAEQAIAACRAGKRAVLIEKPFATTVVDARRVADVSAETGTPVFVGAMHQYDPGWVRSASARRRLTGVNMIRSSIVLPPNPVFEDYATEVGGRPPASSAASPPVVAVRDALMGLAIHDLPLVREFVPAGSAVRVLSADALSPDGYLVTLTAGPVLIQLHAQLPTPGQPRWSLDVDSPSGRLRASFTPSYVHAGSATVEVAGTDGTRTFGPELGNGYEGEWRSVWNVLHGVESPPELDDLVEDLAFAISIADGAAAHVASRSEVAA